MYGEAVIALLGLAPTTLGRMRVATARRVRCAPPGECLLGVAREGHVKGHITRKGFDRLIEDLGGGAVRRRRIAE